MASGLYIIPHCTHKSKGGGGGLRGIRVFFTHFEIGVEEYE